MPQSGEPSAGWALEMEQQPGRAQHNVNVGDFNKLIIQDDCEEQGFAFIVLFAG